VFQHTTFFDFTEENSLVLQSALLINWQKICDCHINQPVTFRPKICPKFFDLYVRMCGRCWLTLILNVMCSAGPELLHAQELGRTLQRIADELDGDPSVQTYDSHVLLFTVITFWWTVVYRVLEVKLVFVFVHVWSEWVSRETGQCRCEKLSERKVFMYGTYLNTSPVPLTFYSSPHNLHNMCISSFYKIISSKLIW